MIPLAIALVVTTAEVAVVVAVCTQSVVVVPVLVCNFMSNSVSFDSCSWQQPPATSTNAAVLGHTSRFAIVPYRIKCAHSLIGRGKRRVDSGIALLHHDAIYLYYVLYTAFFKLNTHRLRSLMLTRLLWRSHTEVAAVMSYRQYTTCHFTV
jgi:hypothetical protein